MLKKSYKIVFVLLISLELSASVKLVAPNYFMQNEELRFQIVTEGFDINTTTIYKIDSCIVDIVKSSKEVILIDFKMATRVTTTYKLYPKDDITIPSFDIYVDQLTIKTEAKTVRLKHSTKTIAKDYDLNMQVNKMESFIGEDIELKLTFKYQNRNIEDYELPELNFPDFLVTEIGSRDFQGDDGVSIEEVTYKITPRKTGRLELERLKTEVETLSSNYKNLNNRSKFIQKKSVYSNKIVLNIKPLPSNVSVVGKYHITAKVDKQRVKAGEIITLVITLQGQGNIDNLDSLAVTIPNATAYHIMSAKNKKKQVYSKTFEIISDTDFTIPAFELDYFDKDENKKKTTKSRALNIKVIGSKTDTKQISKSKNDGNLPNMEKIIFFIMGVFSMLGLVLIFKAYKKFKNLKKEPILIKTIKQTRTQKELYKIIVTRLGKDKTLDALIHLLETNDESKFKKTKRKLILKIKALKIM